MTVSVSFLGIQRQMTQTNHIKILVGDEMRVSDVITLIRERYPHLPFPEHALVVAVNNKVSSVDRILENHDNITFLPLVGGG